MPITFVIIGAAALVFLGIVFAISYIKAPPDMAYIVSGIKKRYLVGKAGFRVPFFERLDKLELCLIQVDAKSKEDVPTADYINIKVDCNVNIKVSTDPEKLALAEKNFLNQDTDYIASTVEQVLQGNIREIVGAMHLEEMVTDRKAFAQKVKENVEPDLAAMGLDIVNFNVQNFSDNDEVIKNLGIDNIVKIRKTAAISKANAERDIAVAQAQAAKEANDAKVASDTEIAKKQNDLAIKKAELKKDADTQLAIAEAAKGIEAEKQRKVREVTAGEANIAKTEKEIALREQDVSIKERMLEAEVKKTAEAEKFAAQQNADAELYTLQKKADANLYTLQKKAEAEKFQQQQDAEAKLIVAQRESEAKKALAEAVKVQGENEAAAIKAKGDAEAAAIKAKALAEAEGLQKKAEAMEKYGEAAKMDLKLQVAKVYCEQLPAIAQAVANGYSKVGNITMYGDQTGKIASGIIEHASQISDGLSKGLGFDLKSLLAGAFGTKALEAVAKTKKD